MIHVHPKDLAADLRDPSRWPDGFRFYFYDAHRCAMGLMSKKYNVQAFTPEATAKVLKIDEDAAIAIFGRRNPEAVSPEDIAADLDALA
jgi:hypothetical protein